MLFQRLAGATLLVFANKQDLPGALTSEEIKEVSTCTVESPYYQVINGLSEGLTPDRCQVIIQTSDVSYSGVTLNGYWSS